MRYTIEPRQENISKDMKLHHLKEIYQINIGIISLAQLLKEF